MEPFKAALENSLGVAGYLNRSGARYQIDAEIKNLHQPLVGLEYDVVANVTYKVSGGGTIRQFLHSLKQCALLAAVQHHHRAINPELAFDFRITPVIGHGGPSAGR